MARRDARQNGAGQRLVAIHVLTGRNRRERARRRDSECEHRLADQVLAQHGPECRAPVAATRVRRAPRALELDVAQQAVHIAHLAQQNCAAVAELRREEAELMSRIGHRNRLGSGQQTIARENRGQGVVIETLEGQPQFRGQRPVDLNQARLRDRRGIQTREEVFGQLRVAAGKRGAVGLHTEQYISGISRLQPARADNGRRNVSP